MTELRLSASAINDFLLCNRMYWYRRFEPEEAVSTEEIFIGQIVHKAIEKFWRDEDQATVFLESFSALSRTGLRHALSSVHGFFDNYKNLLDEKDVVEKYFTIPYPKIKGVNLVGKFDRLSKSSNVYDWKTSRSHPLTLSNNPQFMLYHYAYTQIYKTPPNLFYAGLDGKLIQYKHDEKLFDIFFNDVIYFVSNNILKGNFEPVGLFKYSACDRCLYRTHCYKTLLGKEKR